MTAAPLDPVIDDSNARSLMGTGLFGGSDESIVVESFT